MGMFDWIKCEVPLPDGWDAPGGLQTKDLENMLTTHTITKEGRLLEEIVVDWRLLPKEERTYPDAEEGSFNSMIGCMEYIKETRDANFHGYLHFHGWDSKTEIFHEYRAKFTDGQLMGIERIQREQRPVRD